MKFYKLIEITEDDYISKTNDDMYEYAEQSTIPIDNDFYIAINEKELNTIEIDLDCKNKEIGEDNGN